MTRKEYLEELRKRISNLPKEEIEEAITYYENYFDEAEDDEKVMNELGNPSKLAESILQKIAGMPAVINMEETQYKNEDKDGRFEIPNKNFVKNIALNIKAGVFKIVKDSDFHIEYKNISPSFLYVDSKNDTVEICLGKKGSIADFFNIGWKMLDKSPTLELHIPENRSFDSFTIKMVAGSSSIENYNLKANTFQLDVAAGEFKSKDGSITGKSSLVKVGAGSINLKDFTSETLQAECGMGEIVLTGEITERSKLVTGMGAISLKLKGNEDDYSLDGTVGLGAMKFGNISQSGTGHYTSPSIKEKHFILQVGMGEIKVEFME